MRILIADGDRDLIDLLTYWLRGHGHEVVRAFDGEQALTRWRESRPDLVIMDAELPKLDGFDVCRKMVTESTALVLFLSSRTAEVDEVRALELGADDFLRKPFSPRLLRARIDALVRRASHAAYAGDTALLSAGPICLDSARHEATREGAKVRLTPTESRLLHLLLTHSGQVLPTDMIVERVWGYEDAGDTGLVKTHIRHLRQKIEPEPNTPQYIVTVPGVGYTFINPVTGDIRA
jgi:DNA-binding response OmpR family regulator